MTKKLLPSLLALQLAIASQMQASLLGPITGAVTDTTAVVSSEIQIGTPTTLEVSTSPTFRKITAVEALPSLSSSPENWRKFALTNLKPGTRYYYRFTDEKDAGDERRIGTFKTFPAAGKPASFRFTFGSCSRTGSENPVYARIQTQEPLFHLSVGDLHYENVNELKVGNYRAAYTKVFASKAQSSLYKNAPLAYVWDDHDFCGDDSNGTFAGRPYAIQAYKEMIPHYALAAPQNTTAPITQSFEVGRCLFVVLDLRSQRNSPNDPDNNKKTMLGDWQKEWLKNTLIAAKESHELIFVVSSVSWVSSDKKGDNWSRFANERKELADFFVKNNLVQKLCFLSGDAHMLAADDGTNSNYATTSSPGFPCLQAASLDQVASSKGGPYSEGISLPGPKQGQFGRVDVEDKDGVITVRFVGMNDSGEERIRLTFSRKVAPLN